MYGIRCHSTGLRSLNIDSLAFCHAGRLRHIEVLRRVQLLRSSKNISLSSELISRDPYFLPTESLLRTLQAVALAKVDVRLMLPAKSDSKILTYASYSYIMECMLAGIKVYLYDAVFPRSTSL